MAPDELVALLPAAQRFAMVDVTHSRLGPARAARVRVRPGAAQRATGDFAGARNLRELGEAFVAAASRVSPGDLIYVQHFHLRQGKAGALTPNMPWPFAVDEQHACARLFLRHPMAVATARNPSLDRVAVSDVQATNAWRRSLIYNEVFRRHRFDYQQALNFPLAPHVGCGLIVMRTGLDFTARERRGIEEVYRFAAPAQRRVLRLERARAELALLASGADEIGLAAIRLDEAGRPARFSAEAARLLREHGVTPPYTVLTDWMRHTRGAAPLVVATPLGRLRFRRSAGLVTPGFVFIEELERRTPPPAFEAHGLSRRESEVLHGMTRGWSDAELARELRIGLRTVHEYAARLFIKLGVANREAAVAWAHSVRRRGAVSGGAGLGDPLEATGSAFAFFRHSMPQPDATGALAKSPELARLHEQTTLLENELSRHSAGVILCDADRGWESISTPARRLLHRHFPEAGRVETLLGSLRTRLPLAPPDGEPRRIGVAESPVGVLQFRARAALGGALHVVHVRETARFQPSPAIVALGLSARQAAVLHWIGEGKTNPEIALLLGVGVETIKDHVRRLRRRFAARSRGDLARLAREDCAVGTPEGLSVEV
jgi:DNA-binding NarL/FixJ family response regulator